MRDRLTNDDRQENPALGQIGQYALLRKIGQGGMGTVYRARHVRLKRLVALKLLPPDWADNPRLLARFRREMEAVGRVNHPHVVQATDAGEADGRHFLVMEFIDGPDLARVAQLCGSLAVADACEVARQAALGLQGAHEHGLVHRDVKPSNLILGPEGVVKLLDLGLARLMSEGPHGEELTGSSQVMGTPDYMAPEQGSGGGDVDIRADLYSLGCTLYRLLAGVPPFTGTEYDTALKKLCAHAEVAPPPIRGRRGDVPDGLVAVLDRLMAKAPDQRYPTPDEAAQALGPFAAGADLRGLLATVRQREALAPPVVQPSPGVVTRPAPAPPRAADVATPSESATLPYSPRRRRLATVLAALIVLGVAAVLLAFLLGWFRHPSPDTTAGDTPSSERGGGVAADPADLLAREPEVLLWPDPPGNASHWLDPQTHALHADCLGLGLLALGTAPGPNYRLTLDVEQSGWHGGVGCFFGWHVTDTKDGRVAEYQRIELLPGPDDDRGRTFRLARIVSRVRLSGRSHRTMSNDVLARQALTGLGPGAQTLEVTVGEKGLEKVRWGKNDFPNLVTAEINGKYGPGAYQGLFGVFIQGGAGVFPKARVQTLTGGKP